MKPKVKRNAKQELQLQKEKRGKKGEIAVFLLNKYPLVSDTVNQWFHRSFRFIILLFSLNFSFCLHIIPFPLPHRYAKNNPKVNCPEMFPPPAQVIELLTRESE